jgi:Protein of unknown function (DUF1559)
MPRFSIPNIVVVLVLTLVGLGIGFSIISGLRKVAERALDERCMSNARYVCNAIHGYSIQMSAFPAGTWPNPELAPDERISWCAVVKPYLDIALPGDGLDLKERWNQAGANYTVATSKIGVWDCPASAPVGTGLPQPTSYIGIAGVGADAPLLPKNDRRAGVFGFDRMTRLADIKDGPANTMLIAETARVMGSWIQGGPATLRGLDRAHKPYVGPGRQFGGMHRKGTCVAMADGAVRMIDDSTAPSVFEALSTMAGGEELPSSW